MQVTNPQGSVSSSLKRRVAPRILNSNNTDIFNFPSQVTSQQEVNQAKPFWQYSNETNDSESKKSVFSKIDELSRKPQPSFSDTRKEADEKKFAQMMKELESE